MWTAKWILDAYKEGTEAVKLEMYMAYPDLRRYFEEFEALPQELSKEKADLIDDRSAGAWFSHRYRLVRG